LGILKIQHNGITVQKFICHGAGFFAKVFWLKNNHLKLCRGWV